MRNKVIIITLCLCLVTCGVFGYQLRNIKVKMGTSPAISKNKSSNIEQTLIEADRVISTVRLDSTLFRLPSGFNPFMVPARRIEKTQATPAENEKEVTPAEQIIAEMELSGISWNSISPLAVINHKILKEGDVIPGSEVKIKNIQPALVIVTYQNKEYTLQFK